MADLSLRHLPDLDASGFSELSFQIPSAAHNADDLLLAENTMDFLNEDTLTTPASLTRARRQSSATLAGLTPRIQSTRPNWSALLPQPRVPTPCRETVASELSSALSEDLSPFRNHHPSFPIPSPQTLEDGLLPANNGNSFSNAQALSLDASRSPSSEPLTLSQLTPGPVPQTLPSVTLTDPPQEPAPPMRNAQGSSQKLARDLRQITPDSECRLSTSTLVVLPSVSETVPGENNKGDADQVSKKGKDKVLSQKILPGKQKKMAGSDKPKRKRVATSVALSKPGKLKPLTASIARRLSIPGKKPVPTLRRRPLQKPSPSGVGRRSLVAESSPSTTDAQTFQAGALVDTLLSFNQKLIADQRMEYSEEVGIGPSSATEVPVVPVASVPPSEESGSPSRGSSGTDVHACGQFVSNSDYLTLSQLSPRKQGTPDCSSTANVSRIGQETPTSMESLATSSSVSECPPSPMHRSVKRGGSPADEHKQKRSKTSSEPVAPSSSKEVRLRKPPLQPSRTKNTSAATLISGPSGPSRTRRNVSATVTTHGADRVKRADVGKKPGSLLSRTVSTKSVHDGENDSGAQPIGDTKSTTTSQRNPPTASSNGSCRSGRSTMENTLGGEFVTDNHRQGRSTSDDRPASNLPPAKPTRPTEFQFATTSRMDGRSKTELQKSRAASLKRSNPHAVHPIPDFKALHAVQESVLAQRRAEIHHTEPIQFGLATEARAHGRAKYEEERRAREHELERQAEERRQQRELEEEAEIRELRRRAVPKANEVPEWYAFAPKKERKGSGN